MAPVLCASAIVGTLVLSGCGNSGVATNYASAPVTPAVSDTAASKVTTASIGAELTAAGITFTTKDETAKGQKLKSADAVGTGTRYKIAGGKENIDITVLELKKPEKAADVKKEIEGQWAVAKVISPTLNLNFIDVGNPNLIVTLAYNTPDKSVAMKAGSVIEKK